MPQPGPLRCFFVLASGEEVFMVSDLSVFCRLRNKSLQRSLRYRLHHKPVGQKSTSAGNAPCHRPVGGGSAAGLFRRSSRLRANVCAGRWALGCLVRLLRPRIRFLRENDGKLRAWLARCLHPCVVIYPVATTRLSRSSTGRCCRGHGLFPGSGVCL